MWVALVWITAVWITVVLSHVEGVGALPVSWVTGVNAWTPITALVFKSRLSAVGVTLLTLWVRYTEGLCRLFDFTGIPASLIAGVVAGIVTDTDWVRSARTDSGLFIN